MSTLRLYAPPPHLVALRGMTGRDAPYLAEFSAMPWAEPHFRALTDGEADARDIDGLAAAVVPDLEFPVGFLVYRWTFLSLTLLNWGVHPAYRRMRVGSDLLDLASASARGTRRLLRADVHERDLDSQRFFRARGFAATAVLRGRFLGADGYRMEALS